MSARRALIAGTLAAVLLAGCATRAPEPGASVAETRFDQSVVPGHTTRAELLAAFGPTKTVRFDSGMEAWLYTAPAAGGRRTELVLLLDRDGIVRKLRKRPPYPTDPAPRSAATAKNWGVPSGLAIMSCPSLRCTTTLNMQLPRSSTIPLYTQIKEALRAKIIDGTYVAHQQLPSENEMITAFGVSRITVRQAINDLQKEGLLFKVHGKGTFVALPNVSQELTHLQGFGEAMRLLGHETFSDVFGLKTVKASGIPRAKLQIEDGSPVTEIRRVRYLNREPVSIDYSWVRHDVGARLTEKNLREKDLFSLLENELRQPLHSADVEIDATSASSDVATRLKVAPGSPILRIERLTYAEAEKPLVFEYLHYRAETFKYKMKVLR